MAKSPAESQEDSIAFYRMHEKIEKLEAQVNELMNVLAPLITAMKPPPQEQPEPVIIVVERRFDIAKGHEELVISPHQEKLVKRFKQEYRI